MKLRSMKAGSWIVMIGLMLVLAGGCGVPVRVIGDEYQLTVKKKGNIADTVARTPDERSSALSRTIVDRRDDLGGSGISKKELSFMPYAESNFILPGGESQVLTVLYQTHEGARVIDGLQYGSFDVKTGELRTVRAFLKDPAKLPRPPQQDMGAWSRAHQVFKERHQKNRTGQVNVLIDEQPVISAALRVAGYLARYSHRNADGSLSRFAAIIDPGSEEVHVLYDINMD